MGLMKTLTKIAIGYAAARGVDRLSSGKGLSGLIGGGAQLKGDHPATRAGSDMSQQVQSGMTQAASPMQGILENMKNAGFDLSSMMGGGAMASGGTAAPGGSQKGLLSAMPSAGGGSLAGILAAAGGAAAMGGKGAGQLIDQFNTEKTAPELEKSAGLMLRAMIQAAKADGKIDDEEKAKILELVGDDATEEDLAFVKAELEAPIDIKALAAATPEAQKMPVYSASLMTIRVDTDEEAEYLDQLAKALGLDEPTVNALHLQMGNRPLYI
ncbi:Uncharacterized membrane protein YebE, DUF533 family [Roseivivax lentus]|uniref:Uncharacterized membrane protein YebE, DUF533 family n=1 Tax=Roseivivax lentus TaxID=633194 RepID=A0A1N7N6Y3_9RHOB|nr:DUF533 domain-containing protein [Roseivivax lentus]SIS93921.1 Uncharacterized membrane protein YebE, DUF533 family [Roseivivax lentus]